jgi:hypothetical protein
MSLKHNQIPDGKGSHQTWGTAANTRIFYLNSGGQVKSCGPPAFGLGEGVTSPFLKGRTYFDV